MPKSTRALHGGLFGYNDQVGLVVRLESFSADELACIDGSGTHELACIEDFIAYHQVFCHPHVVLSGLYNEGSLCSLLGFFKSSLHVISIDIVGIVCIDLSPSARSQLDELSNNLLPDGFFVHDVLQARQALWQSSSKALIHARGLHQSMYDSLSHKTYGIYHLDLDRFYQLLCQGVSFRLRKEGRHEQESVGVANETTVRLNSLVASAGFCRDHGGWRALENAVHESTVFQKHMLPSMQTGCSFVENRVCVQESIAYLRSILSGVAVMDPGRLRHAAEALLSAGSDFDMSLLLSDEDRKAVVAITSQSDVQLPWQCYALVEQLIETAPLPSAFYRMYAQSLEAYYAKVHDFLLRHAVLVKWYDLLQRSSMQPDAFDHAVIAMHHALLGVRTVHNVHACPTSVAHCVTQVVCGKDADPGVFVRKFSEMTYMLAAQKKMCVIKDMIEMLPRALEIYDLEKKDFKPFLAVPLLIIMQGLLARPNVKQHMPLVGMLLSKLGPMLSQSYIGIGLSEHGIGLDALLVRLLGVAFYQGAIVMDVIDHAGKLFCALMGLKDRSRATVDATKKQLQSMELPVRLQLIEHLFNRYQCFCLEQHMESPDSQGLCMLVAREFLPLLEDPTHPSAIACLELAYLGVVLLHRDREIEGELVLVDEECFQEIFNAQQSLSDMLSNDCYDVSAKIEMLAEVVRFYQSLTVTLHVIAYAQTTLCEVHFVLDCIRKMSLAAVRDATLGRTDSQQQVAELIESCEKLMTPGSSAVRQGSPDSGVASPCQTPPVASGGRGMLFADISQHQRGFDGEPPAKCPRFG